MKKTVFFIFIVVSMFALLLMGCSSETEEASQQEGNQEPTETEETGTETGTESGPSDGYKESPYLEGKGLPPVEERLPLEPKISNEMPEHQLNYEIGRYGGTLRTARQQATFDGTVWTLATEPLVNSPGRLGEEITPNIVKSYEVSEDQMEFTFVLREGMKWSDGEPLTTEDVRFTYEDINLNEELRPIFIQGLRAANRPDGTPMDLEIIDEYTFKIIFDQPYGGFLLRLTNDNYHDIITPAHYLKQFHKDYADPEELAEMTVAAGFEENEWYNFFNSKNVNGWDIGFPEGIDIPVLYPYIHVRDGDVRFFERNPYYFKVDSAGQQLPYIDELESYLVQDLEMAKVKILAGEIDFSYEFVPVTEVALFVEGAERGGYKVLPQTTLHRTSSDVFLNLTYDDDTWREVVQDIRFRQALNLALDKQEIADVVQYGFAKPAEMLGTEHDLEEANRLLDEMGMERGSDGFRRAPNGEQFIMHFTYAPVQPAHQPTAELVSEQWGQLGLDVRQRQVESSLRNTMVDANEMQVTNHFTHGPVFAPWNDWGANRWARQWQLYHATNGEQGEEPPEEVLEFYQLVDSLAGLSLEETVQVREQIAAHMKENIWYFILNEEISQPVVINEKLRNIEEGFLLAISHGGEEWWFEE